MELPIGRADILKVGDIPNGALGSLFWAMSKRTV